MEWDMLRRLIILYFLMVSVPLVMGLSVYVYLFFDFLF